MRTRGRAAFRLDLLGLLMGFWLPGSAVLGQQSHLVLEAKFEIVAGRKAVMPARLVAVTDLEPASYVLVRGLPAGCVLDHGFRVDQGNWVISAKTFEAVGLSVAPTTRGQFELAFELMIRAGVVAESRPMTLVVTTAVAEPSTPAVSRAPSPPSAETVARAAHEFERARGLLAAGDVRAARLFLQRAAEAGNAEAALTLGSTFDPNTMRDLGVVGMDPDVAQARMWYLEAERLGAARAKTLSGALSNVAVKPKS